MVYRFEYVGSAMEIGGKRYVHEGYSEEEIRKLFFLF